MEKNRDAVQRLVVSYLDVLELARKDSARWARIYAEKAGLAENVAAESIRTTKLDATLPLESIKRISKFLSDNGVITRDVSGEVGEHYDYDFLAKATGKSPDQLGMNRSGVKSAAASALVCRPAAPAAGAVALRGGSALGDGRYHSVARAGGALLAHLDLRQQQGDALALLRHLARQRHVFDAGACCRGSALPQWWRSRSG